MSFIEAPTTFYLGRRYDPETRRLVDDVVYYDSRDLTTHAVVVGMTGSGKTGLCISMLEEAILDNIPAIVIDPKGDITNLLLTFPNLQPQDFKPWINVDDARRAGLSVDEFASDVAHRWRDGLQSWGIPPERLMWLQKAAEYSIYTPGSDAGLPISILASLRAPREGWAGNEEALREKINGITTALLALIGINAQPVQDREHVLIANIFEHAWRSGKDLTLEDVILQIKKPPFAQLGVFPIEKYMPERTRIKLAMDLNNIIAAPSFRSWMQGQPLDIKSLLYQPNGRPRVSIFYIAHLSEAERQFIITLLLENTLGWMRTLSGTTSLRALLYIDEMYGYFPPYPRNPPTKEPILRLLKQARAFGMGMILATQNPGDLDYKGLSNAGTWFIGRLSTENDKKRVVSGLREMASTQDAMDVREVEDLIADVPPRVFLMRNVHDDSGPMLVHTRWAMNYLRGPLTRQQVQELMRDQRSALLEKLPGTGAMGTAPTMPPPVLPGSTGFIAQSGSTQGNSAPHGAPSSTSSMAARGNGPAGYLTHPPALSSAITQYFMPLRLNAQQAVGMWQQRTMTQVQGINGGQLLYKPALLAQASVRYQDRRAGVFTAHVYAFLVPEVLQSGLIHWEDYAIQPVDARALSGEPETPAMFGELSPGLADRSRFTALRRELQDVLYNTALLVVPHNPDLKVYAQPDTDSGEFQTAVQQTAREQRDAELDKLSQRYGKMMDRLEEQLRRKQIELRAEQRELRDRKREEMFTTGEALLSIWRGRTNYTLSRMSRATRYRRQTKEDIHESHDSIAKIEQEIGDLEYRFEQELAQINDKWARIAANNQDYTIQPYKKDIQLDLFGIGWVPAWWVQVNGQPLLLEAF